jgi:hypothetical protein
MYTAFQSPWRSARAEQLPGGDGLVVVDLIRAPAEEIHP